ncbi:hypothetical protein D3C77_347070 [compost metagenome]
MPLLQQLREELRHEDADLCAILTNVVDVLIRKEASEESYEPFARETLYSLRDEAAG